MSIPNSARHVGGAAPEARCGPCRAARPVTEERRARKAYYSSASWRRFTKSMRSGPVVCADCGTSENLSTDHSPEAWDREARGLPRRRQDYEVVCLSCNARRGAARPAHAARRAGA